MSMDGFRNYYQPLLMVGGKLPIKVKPSPKVLNGLSDLINNLLKEEEEEELDLNLDYDSLEIEKANKTKELEEIRNQINNEILNSEKLDDKIQTLKKKQSIGDQKIRHFDNRVKHYKMLKEKLFNMIINEIKESGLNPISEEDKTQIIREIEDKAESPFLENFLDNI